MPIESVTLPRRSDRHALRVVWDVHVRRNHTSVRSANGRLTKRAIDQLKWSVIPPAAGPMIEATPTRRPIMP